MEMVGAVFVFILIYMEIRFQSKKGESFQKLADYLLEDYFELLDAVINRQAPEIFIDFETEFQIKFGRLADIGFRLELRMDRSLISRYVSYLQLYQREFLNRATSASFLTVLPNHLPTLPIQFSADEAKGVIIIEIEKR